MNRNFHYTSEFSYLFYVLWTLFIIIGGSIVCGIFAEYPGTLFGR